MELGANRARGPVEDPASSRARRSRGRMVAPTGLLNRDRPTNLRAKYPVRGPLPVTWTGESSGAVASLISHLGESGGKSKVSEAPTGLPNRDRPTNLGA
eukprot:15980255-Heterocapsa_arctica.AAC.1